MRPGGTAASRGPLAGWRVLVTRADHQAEALSRCLAQVGAEPLELPVIRLLPSPEPERLDAALRAVATFDWVVFTSVNAVRTVADRMAALGIPLEELSRCRLAAIGPATAAALRERGLSVDVVPDEFVGEGVLRALAGRDTWPGRRVLLPRAAQARQALPEGLRALGAKVEVVAAYATGPADPPHAAAVMARLARGEIHAVTFTSPSTVHGFARLRAAYGSMAGRRAQEAADGQPFVVACIGPITAEAARACGLDVDVVASVYTVPGLVQALVDYRVSREKGAGENGLS